MTKERLVDLQFNTLIGMTDERGNAWHRRDDLRRLPDGSIAEDNHYPRFIPVADVYRRLFNWQPKERRVAYLEPCDVSEAQFTMGDGTPCRVIESQAERFGVLRDDNNYDLGIFRTAAHHPYQISLIREAERLTGTVLGISSAGLLAKGGKAWVEFSLPETQHDNKSGFSYRPNLLKADSMDGSMSQLTARTITATVCDNTMSWNLLEAERAGMLFKRRHTSGFTDLQDEREALGILEQTDDEFLKELHTMIEQTVTDRQVEKVLDVLIPVPDEAGAGKTRATNKREQWMELYRSDPMCAPWQKTAFGVLQTDNTYRHWHSQISSTASRSERNTWKAIKGDQGKADRQVVEALELVLA